MYDFGTLSLPQKISYAGGILVLFSALAFIVYENNRTDFAPLYSGLAQTDMGEIAQALKAKKIPYKITDGSIDVPREQMYETRLTLAADGIPKGGGMGFEIFDQQKLGSTEFVQKINYQRALQGELARTINGMSEVAESRVHLVLPEESLFKEDNKPPSAAVVLKLRPGVKVDQKQLQGIAHLVSATVRGLDEEHITVMTTDGQVLFKKNGQDQSLTMSNTQMQRKQSMEDDMRNKIQTMLQQVVGPKVLARVSLDLDFNQVQISEESFNPDSAVVRSQQRTTESSEGKDGGGAKGNPDTPINLEGKLLQNSPQGDGAKGSGKQFNRQREVVNYEINKTSKQIVQMPGNIKKLSVAVIVDGKYEMKGPEGKQKPTYVARAPEEMKSIEDLVRKAVGYNETRGDQITVSNIPFASDAAGGPDMIEGENKYVQLLKTYQRALLNLVLIVLLLIFVVRPFMRKFRQATRDVEGQMLPAPDGGAPGLPRPNLTPEDEVRELLLSGPGKEVSIRRQSAALVKFDPERATEIIRSWLRDEVQ